MTRLPDMDWTTGPLPASLERLALKIFARQYPMAAWGDPSFSLERNDARRFTLQLLCEFAQLDRWTLSNAAEKLTDASCQLVYGDRRLGSTLRNQVRDFAESYLEDLAKLFTGDRSESWKHVPEHEPDESEIEVISKKASIQ